MRAEALSGTLNVALTVGAAVLILIVAAAAALVGMRYLQRYRYHALEGRRYERREAFDESREQRAHKLELHLHDLKRENHGLQKELEGAQRDLRRLRAASAATSASTDALGLQSGHYLIIDFDLGEDIGLDEFSYRADQLSPDPPTGGQLIKRSGS